MKQLFCRLRPHVQAYVFVLGVAMVTPTAALGARFNGALPEDRLLQTPPAFRIHFAAREKPLFMHKPPASLLLQPLTVAVAETETDFRHGAPLAVDGETLTAAAVEQGAASAAPAEAPGAAPFSPEQSRALAEDSLATLRSVPVTFAEDLPAALHSAPAAFASGDNPASDLARGRFYTRLEQLRKLLETLRHLSPPHIGAVDTQYACPVIAVSHLRLSHIGAADPRFGGVSSEDRLLRTPATLRIHFAAREFIPPAAQPHPASLLLQLPAAAVTGVEIDFRHGDPLAVDGAPLAAAPFSPEQSRALAEGPPAALHPVPIASAGGDSLASHTGAVDIQFSGTPAGDRLLQADGGSLVSAIVPGRFQTRLEQLRKLLETLRHLRPPHIGAADPRFGGVSSEDRLLRTPATLRIHFAAREEYPPAAQPHPASLLLQPLTASVAEMETDFRHGDLLAADGETPAAAGVKPGAALFSPEQRRTLAEAPPTALHPVPIASAGGDSLASHIGAVDTQFGGTPAGDRLLQASGDNPAPDLALGHFYTRLEQLRKLLETLRHLSPPHIGAVDTQYARPVIAVSHLRPSHIGAVNPRFSGVLAEDRLLRAPAALHIHFAAREVPPATPSPPASLLLQPLIATGTERSAASAAPAEAPGSAPFPPQQTRAFAEAPPATLRSAQLRCVAADLMQSAEHPLTICGAAS